LGTLKDVLSGFPTTEIAPEFAAEEARLRDVRTEGILPSVAAPLAARIPGASQLLEGREFILGREEPRRGATTTRQVTGLIFRGKTPVQREADRLGLTSVDKLPPSGIPELDRLIAKAARPVAERLLTKEIRKPIYIRSTPAEKRDRFLLLLRDIRADARDKVFLDRPDLQREFKVKRIPRTERDILRERGRL
ncbi:hypothetical protein LCGC14_2943890, partial [marine sediment metagenome]